MRVPPHGMQDSRCLSDDDITALLEGQLVDAPLREAHAHLAECAACRTLWTTAAQARSASSLTMTPVASGAPLVEAAKTSLLPSGTNVGRFVVLRIVGSGGMGVVYSAYDPELDRKVALKFLRLHRSGSDETEQVLRQCLQREAKAMARIVHPSVITVYDIGTFASDVFIAMELVDGFTFSEWCAARPRRRDEILALLRKAGEGLAAAHRVGIIHRDLKPENIFLVQDSAVSGGERAKILDFGIAKIQDGSALKDVDSPGPLTTVGKILGTPTYMSPEQCEGRVALTSASDIYALGVIFYEMLSGKPPFGGVSENAVMALHMLREPVPLSQIPRSLNSLVQAMLAKQPSQRPTLPQIRSILQSYLARPDSTHWASRWLVMVMIGMCSLGILALFWTTGRRNIAPAPTTPGSDLAARPDLLTLPHDLAAVPSAQLSPPSSSDGGAGNTVIPRAVAVSPAPMGAERSGVPSTVGTIPKGSRKQPVVRPSKASEQPVEPEKLQVPIVE